MKKSKVLILSLGMALCVGGGIGAAAAINRQVAGNTGKGDFDKAINLCWDSGQSSATIQSIDALEPNVPQYRFLSVTPKSSKSVAGTVTVSFTLSAAATAEGKSYSINGLTVSVFKTDSLATKDTVAGLIADKVASPILTKANPTGSTSFTVSTADSAHETNAYYAIEVKYDGSKQDEGKLLGGKLDISQSFAIAA